MVDGALYMMAWCQNDPRSDLFDADTSLANFQRIVEEYPDSRFAAQANYFVGLYYFDKNENEAALEFFEKATEMARPDLGEYDSLFEYANYRLAWTHYLLNEYEEALALFTQAQDYSIRKNKDTGQPSNTLEESLEYTALSFADIADIENRQAVEVAHEYYEKHGEREHTADVFVFMADQLTQQVRIVEAMDTYSYLQDHWPYSPDNPNYQKKLAELLLEDGELDGYYDAMALLTERYAENGDWWIQIGTIQRPRYCGVTLKESCWILLTTSITRPLNLRTQQITYWR